MPKPSVSNASRPRIKKKVPSLPEKLEKALDSGAVELVIPNLLLPARWQKKADGGDLAIRLNDLFLIEVRNVGPSIAPVELIKLSEARKFLREVGEACRRYRELLGPYSSFLERWADNPGESRSIIKSVEKEDPLASAFTPEQEVRAGTEERRECPTSKDCSTS